jgi:hypothetical protein
MPTDYVALISKERSIPWLKGRIHFRVDPNRYKWRQGGCWVWAFTYRMGSYFGYFVYRNNPKLKHPRMHHDTYCISP